MSTALRINQLADLKERLEDCMSKLDEEKINELQTEGYNVVGAVTWFVESYAGDNTFLQSLRDRVVSGRKLTAKQLAAAAENLRRQVRGLASLPDNSAKAVKCFGCNTEFPNMAEMMRHKNSTSSMACWPKKKQAQPQSAGVPYPPPPAVPMATVTPSISIPPQGLGTTKVNFVVTPMDLDACPDDLKIPANSVALTKDQDAVDMLAIAMISAMSTSTRSDPWSENDIMQFAIAVTKRAIEIARQRNQLH